MRIIAGKAGRIAIKVPTSITRPTTDLVRQALFSILGEKVLHARTLDLYCGSGALGLEALSRGAASCTFVDSHHHAIATTQENLLKAKLPGGHTIKSQAIPHLLTDTTSYDLIFADPPYWKGHGTPDHIATLLTLPTLPARLTPHGYLIAEISSSQPTPPSPHLILLDRRKYGSCTLLIFTHPTPAP